MRTAESTFRRIAPLRRAVAAVPAPELRLPRFIGLESDPAARLRRLVVAIVGLGSVGRSIAEKLARQQVGALLLGDNGRLKAESLLTHSPLLPADVVGQPNKAFSAGRLCGAISPSTDIYCTSAPVQELDQAAFGEADVVVMATDNLAAEVEVAQRCLHLGRALVHAAVHGESLTAQIRFFRNDGPGACPRCSYTEFEEQQLVESVPFSCTPGAAGVTSRAPTMSTPSLCSMAADLTALTVLRFALDLGQPLSDQQIEYCAYTHRTAISPLSRSERCRCDHTTWRLSASGRPLPDRSLRDVADEAELGGKLSFTVGGHRFVRRGVCESCGDIELARFVADGQPGRCPRCGGDVRPVPYRTFTAVPIDELGPLVDVPLGPLGAQAVRSVLVNLSESFVLVHNPLFWRRRK